ncbi:hypothetical protein KR50_16900 [Jeotgalibacillus campisalis]|uniref:Uncharacterized protein n=1 Tax=Jeotgalibacillus campisalis TaxID=220754 RepID=A0A0C2VU74_9BACL|nr:hypothetical protein KR50_16900 [Jeotgalibacillus campisalis]
MLKELYREHVQIGGYIYYAKITRSVKSQSTAKERMEVIFNVAYIVMGSVRFC